MELGKGRGYEPEDYFDGDIPTEKKFTITQKELSKMSVPDLYLALTMIDDCVFGERNRWGGPIKQSSFDMVKAEINRREDVSEIEKNPNQPLKQNTWVQISSLIQLLRAIW